MEGPCRNLPPTNCLRLRAFASRRALPVLAGARSAGVSFVIGMACFHNAADLRPTTFCRRPLEQPSIHSC